MSFNSGFTTQGIPFITGSSDGQALGWSAEQQMWVATGSVDGGGGGISTVSVDNTLQGNGSPGSPIGLKPEITASLTSSQILVGDITVTGTASIAQLNTVNQDILYVGDKYIVLQSGSATSIELDGAGIQFGSGSISEGIDDLGSIAHIRYSRPEKIEIKPGVRIIGTSNIDGDLEVNSLTASNLQIFENTSLNNLTASNITASSINSDSYALKGNPTIFNIGEKTALWNKTGNSVVTLDTDENEQVYIASIGYIQASASSIQLTASSVITTGGFTGSFSGSFIGDGSEIINLSATAIPGISASHIVYVSQDGDDSNIGSFNKPFQTIQQAVDYASSSYNDHSEAVQIKLLPGVYSGFNVTRKNIYFTSDQTHESARPATVNGAVNITLSGSQKYNDICGFNGILFTGGSGLDSPLIHIQGTGSSNIFIQNSKLYTDATSTEANLIRIDGNFGEEKVNIKDCAIQANQGYADIIKITGGDIEIDSCRIYSNNSPGNNHILSASGICALTIDRVLIEHSSSNPAIRYNGSGRFVLSNSSLTKAGPEKAIETSTISGSIIVNTLFGSSIVAANISNISNNLTIQNISPGLAYYANLTSLVPAPLNGKISVVNCTPLEELHGNTIVNNLSSSTHVSASYFTGSTANFSNLTGSAITGSRAIITNITGTNIAATYLSSSTVSASHVNVDYIDFDNSKYDLTVTRVPSHQPGRIFFDSGSTDLVTGLNYPDLYLKNGQQLVQRVKNAVGTTLSRGKVVHITGSDQDTATTPRVRIADWSNDNYSANTLGVVMRDIAGNSEGYIIISGMLDGLDNIDPDIYDGGDVLYLSSSGDFTNVKPIAPKHAVSIGQVVRVSNGNNGTIYVKIQNGYELDELHDVSASNATNGDLLVRNGTLSPPLWVSSKSLTGSYGISGNLTASEGFRTPNGVESFITASRAVTASYAVSAAGVQGSENFARIDQSNNFQSTSDNTFAGTSSFNGPVTASSEVLFQQGFTVTTAKSGTFLGSIYVGGTASIAHLETLNQTSLNIGDKYIVILSQSAEHNELNEGGLYWGSGNLGGASVDKLGAHAHVNFNSIENRLEIFPGLFISGTLSGSDARLNSLTSSYYTGSNAVITSITASQFTGSVAVINQITASEYTGSKAVINDITASNYTGSLAVINTITSSYYTGSYAVINEITASSYTGSLATIDVITSSYFTGSYGIINEVTASSYTGSLAVIDVITASYYTGSYAEITEITASSYTGSLATVEVITASYFTGSYLLSTQITSSELTSSKIFVSEITASRISAGNINALAGITGSFSGSGALISNLTGANWNGGTGSFFTDIQSAFTGSGGITIKPTVDGTGRYEISSSGGSGGISEVFTRSPLSGSGSSEATAITIDPTQPITASAFSASTFYYGDGSKLIGVASLTSPSVTFQNSVTSSQYSASSGFTGSYSGSFGYINIVTASSGVSSSFFYGNGAGITNVSASTSKLNEIVLTPTTTDIDFSLLRTGSLMAISGNNLTTASFADEKKANFIGILTRRDGNSYTIATSGIVSGSNAGGSLFQGGQIVYVSSSGLVGTYDGISSNSYITQVGIASFDVAQSGSIILQPRIFGIKG